MFDNLLSISIEIFTRKCVSLAIFVYVCAAWSSTLFFADFSILWYVSVRNAKIVLIDSLSVFSPVASLNL